MDTLIDPRAGATVRTTGVIDVDTALLRSWLVPMPAEQGDKEIRGHVLVLGGSCEMPGAIILAATAALRAGAGKLTIATGQSVAQLVALAMPEARVIGLPEHASAGLCIDMAHLTGIAKDDINAAPDLKTFEAAQAWNAVVALKGAPTVIPTPDETLYQHEGGNVGLAISGSGDVLAGVIAGLAARGAPLDQAACWGVVLHARAGECLAQRMGTLGHLAREISQEIPALLEQVAGKAAGGGETIRPQPVGWGVGV